MASPEKSGKKVKKPPPPANERLPPKLSKQIDKHFGETIAAAQAAKATADEAEVWRQRAAKAENDAERMKAQIEALDLEKKAEKQIKLAKKLESGAWQGAGAGMGIGAATGMGVGTVVGTIVGGATAIPTTLLGGLIGAGTGAIHGPWVTWTGMGVPKHEEGGKIEEEAHDEQNAEMDVDKAGGHQNKGEQVEQDGASGKAMTETAEDEEKALEEESEIDALENDDEGANARKRAEILKAVAGHVASASQTTKQRPETNDLTGNDDIVEETKSPGEDEPAEEEEPVKEDEEQETGALHEGLKPEPKRRLGQTQSTKELQKPQINELSENHEEAEAEAEASEAEETARKVQPERKRPAKIKPSDENPTQAAKKEDDSTDSAKPKRKQPRKLRIGPGPRSKNNEAEKNAD
jgi:hypothetical protein